MSELNFSEIEKKWQDKWEEGKIFYSNPSSDKEKFFMTIPYPYISGSLHIGHARVVIEGDVFSRFQRMLGKNVLYPIAFHISGTPVLGISLAIKNKDPKKIDLYRGYVSQYVSDEKEVEKIVSGFEDPQKIVDFFIPKMVEEFSLLGLSVDWRRQYTSGDFEHQALVEWQFRKYKEKGYLVQDKYPILFSKTLNNAVGEDDILDGDTNPVEVSEFVGIKFSFEDGFLIAATLRPETMYGQTNMWINPNVNYCKIKCDGEIFFVSKPCFEKLKFQDHVVELIDDNISGNYFLGKTCFAPFVEKDIIILPSIHCDENIGSGIVTSVPSDAPFDYISLIELQNSKELCDKYSLDYDLIKKIELIPILESKGFGKFAGKEICEKLNITNLSQDKELQLATQEVYKAGFHTGKLAYSCGEYNGLSVRDAKDKMKDYLISNNKAIIFYETSRKAVSRDGGEVIVAVLDNQWFLDFNANNWKKMSSLALEKIDIWPDKYRKQFNDVFDWLDKRPCARMRGIGTKFPFDNNWVIESLSDSTIYMALYPIIHLIRKNNISKEQLSDDFFEFVMNNKGNLVDVSKKLNISETVLVELNKEWNYWYPFDHRHTFTLHLSNHLSFMIFAHTAIFEEKHWPKRISFHGMVISEGEKMSKSKGNVVSIIKIKEDFGADPFRAFMCNSASVESTFNWDSTKVNLTKSHLENLFLTIKNMQIEKKEVLGIENFSSFVSKLNRFIKDATFYLEKMDLRNYSKIVLYDIFNEYKKLKNNFSSEELVELNYYLSEKWIKLLSPLVPHLAEELWKIIGEKDFVSLEDWPKADESKINLALEKTEEVIDNVRKDILVVKDLAKIDNISKVKIIVAPQWKWKALELVQAITKDRFDFSNSIKLLMGEEEMKKHSKEVSVFLKAINNKQELLSIARFDEEDLLNKIKPKLESEFGEIEIIAAEESSEAKARNALPGKPALIVE